MQLEECLQVLGVSGDADEAEIRRAYLDLVQIWHPDRFQSDSRLRKRAENQLRKINEAYRVLKRRQSPPRAEQKAHDAPAQASTEDSSNGTGTPESREAGPGEKASIRWEPLFSPYLTLLTFVTRSCARFVYAGILIALCLAPLWAAAWVSSLLRVPALDLQSIQSGVHRPRILRPMDLPDPRSSVPLAADLLTEWAMGSAIDLWKAKPATFSAPAPQVSATASEMAPEPRKARSSRSEKRMARAMTSHRNSEPTLKVPDNGTELIAAARRSGAGELQIINKTNLDAIARLVRPDGTAERIIYICANRAAHLDHIHLGLYELTAELGKGLHPQHLQFQNQRIVLRPEGQFNFFETSTASGTTGQSYEISITVR